MNKAMFFVSIFIFSCGIKSFKEVKKISSTNKIELLSNGVPTYWDPHFRMTDDLIGFGLYVISEDKLVMYEYSKDKPYKRSVEDFYDIKIDTVKWKQSNDTLFISYLYKFKILKFRNDSLEAMKINKEGQDIKILFIKSTDQTTPLKYFW